MIFRKILDRLERIDISEKWWRITLVCYVAVCLLIPYLIYMGWLRIPPIQFFNGMAIQSKARAQSPEAVFEISGKPREVLPGTYAQDIEAYPYRGQTAIAEKVLVNPLTYSTENLTRGEKVFDNYCQPCHGFKGMADGTAVGPGRLPAPVTLHSPNLRSASDGNIFDAISQGRRKMPSYAQQIPPLDRWAAVLYVRALQQSMNTPQAETSTTETKKSGLPREAGKSGGAQ